MFNIYIIFMIYIIVFYFMFSGLLNKFEKNLDFYMIESIFDWLLYIVFINMKELIKERVKNFFVLIKKIIDILFLFFICLYG